MSRRKSAFPFTTQRAGPCARLASAQLTRPTPGDITMLYWDGRDNAATPFLPGAYTAALETVISGNRQKATVDLTVQ